MKTFGVILFALFIVCNLSFAQDTLYIYKSGSLVTKRAVSDIDSITFIPITVTKVTPGSGGIITQYTSNGITYAVHTFTYDAIFYPPKNLTQARVLLVGAGGNGGGAAWDVGGGGGGGEVKEADVLISGSSMAVTVSLGGSSVSSFGGQSALNGLDGVGGTGGNGGASGNGIHGGIGMSKAGGGGGGGSTYGSDGIADNWNPVGGNGGDGIAIDISGISIYYGGGGGGGAWTGYDGKNGKGGLGGGGGAVSKNGEANTGGGGCGASYTSGGGYSGYILGGSGGSGVVIISYPL